jgi:hypothetical protein
MYVTFVESWVFTERVIRMGLDGAVGELQAHLLKEPEVGDLDPGTGGLRKVRMRDRVGARGNEVALGFITSGYRESGGSTCYVYGKDEASALTRGQKQALAEMSRAIKLAAGEEDR